MHYEYSYWAIIASATANFLIGYIWFTILFKDTHSKEIRTHQSEEIPAMPTALVLHLIGNLLLAIVLNWLLKALGCTTLLQSVQLAAILWLGFIVAIMGPIYAWQRYSFSVFLVTAGAALLYMISSALILTLWEIN